MLFLFLSFKTYTLKASKVHVFPCAVKLASQAIDL